MSTELVDQLSRDNLLGFENGSKVVFSNGDEYELAGKIGDGAIGIVRKAKKDGKTYALKVLAPEFKYIDEEAINDICRRFRREGERGVELKHNNLVQVISYESNELGDRCLPQEGKASKNPFLVMEYIQGRTLESYIKMSKPNLPTSGLNFSGAALSIALRITEALVYLHRKGLIHRDVKPANIFLTKSRWDAPPDAVKLGDFGIVKWGDFKQSITTGTLTTTEQSGLGTLKYMPPEQAINPKDIDVKADMFSLGIMLYELFTNQILGNVHHVGLLKDVRRDSKTRTIESKMSALGFEAFSPEMQTYSVVFDMILDCMLAPSGRPSSVKMLALLKRFYDDED